MCLWIDTRIENINGPIVNSTIWYYRPNVCQVDATIKHICYCRPNVCQVDAMIKNKNEYIILSNNDFFTTHPLYSI